MVGQQILALPVGVRIPAPQYHKVGRARVTLALIFYLVLPLCPVFYLVQKDF